MSKDSKLCSSKNFDIVQYQRGSATEKMKDRMFELITAVSCTFKTKALLKETLKNLSLQQDSNASYQTNWELLTALVLHRSWVQILFKYMTVMIL